MGIPNLWDAASQGKKTKLKHTSGLNSGKTVKLAHIFLDIFLDYVTPKPVYIRTERLKSAFDNGDKMMPKRHVMAFIFLLKH